jgi:voltage-gated potassium channel
LTRARVCLWPARAAIHCRFLARPAKPSYTAVMEPSYADRSKLKKQTYVIVFLADTKAGRAFDVLLLLAILASVAAVMLESVAAVAVNWGTSLWMTEVVFTSLFTLEYMLRLWCSPSKRSYAFSFWGIVDLAAILPTYLTWLFPGAHALLVIRAIRLLRVFQIFKLREYLNEETMLRRALANSLPKIVVFLLILTNVIVIMGALMYIVEGPEAGFTSIPRGVYWAVVTVSTVGFGDITPVSALGQTIAGMLMLLGYCLIVVPTALVSAELAQSHAQHIKEASCPKCQHTHHLNSARFCHHCGDELRGL